jgi:Na+(H+)/acetate symporter ActP
MPHISRLIYAFFMSVISVGIMSVIIMIFGFDIGDIIYSNVFFVPVFVVSYLIAPILNKYIKFKC